MNYPTTVPGFQDAIREYVLHSIGISFRRVSTRVLADWLRLEPPALKQLLADKVCCVSAVCVCVRARVFEHNKQLQVVSTHKACQQSARVSQCAVEEGRGGQEGVRGQQQAKTGEGRQQSTGTCVTGFTDSSLPPAAILLMLVLCSLTLPPLSRHLGQVCWLDSAGRRRGAARQRLQHSDAEAHPGPDRL